MSHRTSGVAPLAIALALATTVHGQFEGDAIPPAPVADEPTFEVVEREYHETRQRTEQSVRGLITQLEEDEKRLRGELDRVESDLGRARALLMELATPSAPQVAAPQAPPVQPLVPRPLNSRIGSSARYRLFLVLASLNGLHQDRGLEPGQCREHLLEIGRSAYAQAAGVRPYELNDDEIRDTANLVDQIIDNGTSILAVPVPEAPAPPIPVVPGE